VADTDANTVVAAAIDAAITASGEILSMSTGVAAGVVTLTAKQAGAAGSRIDVRLNHLGLAAGEKTPAGITIVIAAGVAGATNPDISSSATNPLAASLGDTPFDYIVQPWIDTTSLDEFELLMNDVTGRWAWNRQIWGQVFTAHRATVAALGTFGNLRNDPHMHVMGLEPTPMNPWVIAAAAVGRESQSINIDPARPTQTLELIDMLAAKQIDRFTQGQRNTLLFDGIATLVVTNESIRIERMITTSQKDALGNISDAFLDDNTLFTLMRFNRRMRTMVETKFPRSKLANDGTPIAVGQAIVTPSLMKGEIIAEYDQMVIDGLMENAELFADNLTVVRPAGDPNRLDVVVQPDVINQLRVLAMANRFRLQYPDTLIAA
jgi:phage tail sheath gpL-like